MTVARDSRTQAVVNAISEVLRTGRREPSPDGVGQVEGLDELLAHLEDIAGFARALAKGDLDQELRQSGVAAGALKDLQGALRHVTWQTQRVAAGDLGQRVDFMGDFAEAFNRMVDALAEARETLVAKNEELNALNQELEKLAVTDALTGIWNRRKFNELVDAELARARRYGHPFALCLMDVDYFKRVNDTAGHMAGDAVLQKLAGVIHGQLREVDNLARWGGEEFAVLCPDVTVDECRELAERIRRAVAEHAFGVAVPVTVSLGVTGHVHGDTADTLVSRADAALYRAKRGGRNRLELAG